jgi:hypothetical protein
MFYQKFFVSIILYHSDNYKICFKRRAIMHLFFFKSFLQRLTSLFALPVLTGILKLVLTSLAVSANSFQIETINLCNEVYPSLWIQKQAQSNMSLYS